MAGGGNAARGGPTGMVVYCRSSPAVRCYPDVCGAEKGLRRGVEHASSRAAALGVRDRWQTFS